MMLQLRLLLFAVVLWPISAWAEGGSDTVNPAPITLEVRILPSTTKVHPEFSVPAQSIEAIEAARNEWVAFQILLTSMDAYPQISVELSDLAGPDGASISRDSAELFLEHFLDIQFNSACEYFVSPDCEKYDAFRRTKGLFPDPLIPFRNPYSEEHETIISTLELQPDQVQVVWVELLVPRDAKPGDYNFSVTISDSTMTLADLPLTLTVWDFEIPMERSVGTAYNSSFTSVNKITQYHGGVDGSDGETLERIRRNYELEVHKHRMDFTTLKAPVTYEFDEQGNLLPVDYTEYDAFLGPRLDGDYYPDGIGQARFNAGMFRPGSGMGSLTEDQFAEAARNYAEHLQEKGWLDKVYFYSSDEPWLPQHDGAIERIIHDVGVLHRKTDLLKGHVLVTGPWLEELDGIIDIWCPVTAMYDDDLWPRGTWAAREKYRYLLSLGQKLWFYVCNANFPALMGYDIDTKMGYEPRLTKWGAWVEGATGFLYWRLDYWPGNDPWHSFVNVDEFGPQLARNGDGILVYPGDHDGTLDGIGSPDFLQIDGPVISYRMKQIRDGLEDWEVFILADKAGIGEYARKEVSKAYTAFGAPLNMNFDIQTPPWTLDENVLLDARRKVAAKLQYTLHPDLYPDPDAPPVVEPDQDAVSQSDSSDEEVSAPSADASGDVKPEEPEAKKSSGCSTGTGNSRVAFLFLALLLALSLLPRRRMNS